LHGLDNLEKQFLEETVLLQQLKKSLKKLQQMLKYLKLKQEKKHQNANVVVNMT